MEQQAVKFLERPVEPGPRIGLLNDLFPIAFFVRVAALDEFHRDEDEQRAQPEPGNVRLLEVAPHGADVGERKRVLVVGADLHRVAPIVIDSGVVGDRVPAHEHAAGLQVLQQQRHRRGDVHVVQRIACINYVELRAGGKPEVLGGGDVGLDLQAVLLREAAGGVTHPGGDVARGDVGAKKREIHRGLAEAAADVEQSATAEVAERSADMPHLGRGAGLVHLADVDLRHIRLRGPFVMEDLLGMLARGIHGGGAATEPAAELVVAVEAGLGQHRAQLAVEERDVLRHDLVVTEGEAGLLLALVVRGGVAPRVEFRFLELDAVFARARVVPCDAHAAGAGILNREGIDPDREAAGLGRIGGGKALAQTAPRPQELVHRAFVEDLLRHGSGEFRDFLIAAGREV